MASRMMSFIDSFVISAASSSRAFSSAENRTVIASHFSPILRHLPAPRRRSRHATMLS